MLSLSDDDVLLTARNLIKMLPDDRKAFFKSMEGHEVLTLLKASPYYRYWASRRGIKVKKSRTADMLGTRTVTYPGQVIGNEDNVGLPPSNITKLEQDKAMPHKRLDPVAVINSINVSAEKPTDSWMKMCDLQAKFKASEESIGNALFHALSAGKVAVAHLGDGTKVYALS